MAERQSSESNGGCFAADDSTDTSDASVSSVWHLSRLYTHTANTCDYLHV